ncbi:MAG: PEP-CTERM sorting domain-containing protein, partial [Phycisphaerae bacterium]
FESGGLTSQDTNGFSWFTFNQPDGLLGLTLAPVPEPSVWLLLLVGAGTLALWPRRGTWRRSS